MVIRCMSCGASLDVPDDQDFTTCRYCGANTRVASRRPDPDPEPEPKVERRVVVIEEHVPAPAPRRARKGWGCSIVVAFGMLTLAGGVAFYFLYGWRYFTGFHSAACLVDANGDKALDVLGWRGKTSANDLTIFDGNDGEILWTSDESYPENTKILCLSKDHFGLAIPGFGFETHVSRSPTNWSRTELSDEIAQFGAGPGCVHVKTKDGKSWTFALPDLVAGPCDVPADQPAYQTPGLDYNATSIERTSKHGTRYTLEKREKGSPVLTARAFTAGEQIWERQLRWVAVGTGALAMEVTPKVLVVYGMDPAGGDVGVLIGLDRRSGEVLYETRIDDRLSGRPRSVGFNGRFVILAYALRLAAHDPETGENSWIIGQP